jgi:hypothetical protein
VAAAAAAVFRGRPRRRRQATRQQRQRAVAARERGRGGAGRMGGGGAGRALREGVSRKCTLALLYRTHPFPPQKHALFVKQLKNTLFSSHLSRVHSAQPQH